jgi:hypothetical protein
MGTRGQAIIHEHLRSVVAELIVDEVKKEFQRRRKAGSYVSADLLAQHIASTFILVLNWWLENRNPLPPSEVDGLFRALIVPTLTEALGSN